MTPTNFREYYKNISNSELLHILHNADDYQPAAIEAAEQEFLTRQLSEAEITEAKEPVIALQLKKEKQKEGIRKLEDGVRNTGNWLLHTLNPVQNETPTVEKSIGLIVIVFSALFVYQVFKDYPLLEAYAQDFSRSPVVSSLILLPFVVLPIAIFTLWKKRKIGWMLLTIYLTFSIAGLLWTFYQFFSWRYSGFERFDKLFPRPPLLQYIFQLLFLVGTLYVLCKKNIRDVFLVTKNEMLIAIAATAALFIPILAMKF